MRGPIHRAAGAASLSLMLMLMLAGCGGEDKTPAAAPPAPPPTSSIPAPAGANFNVLSCISQQVAPGVTVASLIIPDTITIDLAGAPGFPNGRQLTDSVIDVILAVLFLDLTKEPVTRFTNLPLGPQANDLPFRPNFPYLAAAQGSPPLSPVATTGFNFRTDPASAYVRVDRMGKPAVATVLISSSTKVRYNDGDPIDDDQLDYYEDITKTLKSFTDALSDDFAGAGLKMCATPN